MVTSKRDTDDRERATLEDDEPDEPKADSDLDEFFFDEDEPSTSDRRRDPLRKL